MSKQFRILLADDDPTIGLLMRATLDKAGYQVCVVGDGLAALAQFENEIFDLAMLDVDMPGMNGIDVCAALRAKFGPQLPIMMVTGRDDVDSIEHAYRAGATGFVVKPIHWALIPHRVGFQLRAAKTLTELREAKQRSEEISAGLVSTLEAIPDLVFEVDRDGRYLSVHAQAHELLVASPESVIGKHVADVLPADAASVCMAALREARETGVSRGRRYALKLAQGLRCFELSVARKEHIDPAKSDFVVLARDITQLEEQRTELDHLAYFDVLTGLPNRVLLSARLKQSIQQARLRSSLLAVAYLDLDEFNQVNERFGHDIGDRLLIAIAERLKNLLRDGDTLARIGGDEFVLVLSDFADEQECLPVIDQLLLAASMPVTMGEHMIRVTASIGVTHYPKDAVEAELLMRHANQAMYQAKQTGKNCYQLFDVAQDAAIKTMHETIERLRRALTKGEFVLFYQPKVDLSSAQVIGVEALIRWLHPERGLLTPVAFLPLFEDNLFSIDVGEWVIDTALDQVQAWRAQGLVVPVSVNIGGLQLQQDDFVTRLGRALADRPELPTGTLQLELLETTALNDWVRVSQVIKACSDIGVGFALDDFGTGYSSLAYLKHFPVDTLKIDQNFVRDMLDDPGDLAIVKGVIGLAQAFGREVIAEGVETRAHGELLRSIGCTRLQGYGIAQPMADDVEQALPAHRGQRFRTREWCFTHRRDGSAGRWRRRLYFRDWHGLHAERAV